MPGMNDAYDLIPAELAAQLPPLYSMENEKDPLVRVKLFTPTSNWTWFLFEYSPEDQIAFGLVKGLESELGYVSIEELASAVGPLGLKVERDLYWTPKPLSECK